MVPNQGKSTSKWGALRDRAQSTEGRKELARASTVGTRGKFLWSQLKSASLNESEKVEPEAEEKSPERRQPRTFSIFDSSTQLLQNTKLFDEVRAEVLRTASGQTIQDRDVDALHRFSDYMSYLLENSVSAIPGIALYLLIIAAAIVTVILATMWVVASSEEEVSTQAILRKVFITIQVLTTGGYGIDLADSQGEKAVFLLGLISGLVMVAILLAIITEAFSARMAKIVEGKTKVVERGHTLILGWNESTIRIVCQIAFLRRGFLKQNETVLRTLFPWLRAIPSSPVAKAPVIVMADNLTKEEMDSRLGAALAERGINPRRTCIGWDVVCRVGNPHDPHDLIRVNAHEATAILITTTEKDIEMERKSGGKLKNGATIRTLLALRHVLYSNEHAMDTMDTRSIRIVSQFCRTCEYSDAATFVSPKGHRIVFNLDLNYFTNALMFWCAAKPGLSQVYLQILNFEGVSLRCRPASELSAGVNNEKGYLIGKKLKDSLLCTHWGNAILMGLCPDERLEKNMGKGHAKIRVAGICADPEHRIASSDLIIFLGKSSMPAVSKNRDDLSAFAGDNELSGKGAELKRALKESEEPGGGSSSKVSILVCGWRAEWSDGNPLRRRLVDIAARVSRGSSVTFLNDLPDEEFSALMENNGLPLETEESGRKSWRLRDVDPIHGIETDMFIYHITGDASDIKDLGPLLLGEENMNRFQTAIVLANTVLPRELHDVRVLSILLLLRHLSSNWTEHLHVIADNHQDQTALIAVAPNSTSDLETLPDFLPSTTIEARALTMALAYPHMQGAIEEFFVDENPDDGTPEINFLDVATLGLLGRDTRFSDIATSVQEFSASWAVAFGYMTFQGEMVLAPPPGTKGVPLSQQMNQTRPFMRGDRIIIMHRLFVGGKEPDFPPSADKKK